MFHSILESRKASWSWMLKLPCQSKPVFLMYWKKNLNMQKRKYFHQQWNIFQWTPLWNPICIFLCAPKLMPTDENDAKSQWSRSYTIKVSDSIGWPAVLDQIPWRNKYGRFSQIRWNVKFTKICANMQLNITVEKCFILF